MRKAVGVAFVFVAGLVSLPALPAAAQDAQAVPASLTDPDTRSDVEAYSKLNGVSLQVAERELAEEGKVAALYTTLQEATPDTFAGVWIEHRPYRVVVALTADLTKTQPLIDAAGLSARPVVRAARFSLAQLEEAQASAGRLDVPTDTSIDIANNRVDVHVLEGTDQSRLGAGVVNGDERVNVREVKALSRPAAINMFGGLGGADHQWSGCPSGFTVVDGLNRKGVITAGHCGNEPLSYKGFDLPYVRERWSGSSDAQFHLAPSPTFAVQYGFIYNAAQNWRNVTWVRPRTQIVVGMSACKYGPVTKDDCGTIDSTTFKPNWVPAASPAFYRAWNCDNDMAIQGDSGGPVFVGSWAYGIISGYEDDLNPFCFLRNKVIWNTLSDVQINLAVSVLVVP